MTVSSGGAILAGTKIDKVCTMVLLVVDTACSVVCTRTALVGKTGGSM